jgi:ATP:ADP antiporter, AAA family
MGRELPKLRQLSVDPGPGGILLRRAGNFAFARPTREVLFTIVPREDKYKAKSFIDTVIHRTGDQVGAWSFAALGFLGLAMTGISIVAVPISIGWLLNALWLGRKQERLARAETSGSPLLAK